MTKTLPKLDATIGVRADGLPLSVPLAEFSTLVAGMPGTGKSGTLRAILVAAAQRPSVALVGVDPKRLELRPWAARFSHLAVDLDEITVLLRALVVEMDARYAQLETEGLTRWPVSVERPQIVLVVDELAEVVASGEPGDSERALLVRRLVSKGRAAGIIVIAATQRPSADVIPTSLRDLFALRIAHATANRESTEMILGPAWRDGPAHELPIGDGHQGRCFAIGEGERIPAAARVWAVSDDLVRRVVERHAASQPDFCLPVMKSQHAPRGGAVNPEQSEPVGVRVDGTSDGATLLTHGHDEATVLAALVSAAKPLRFGELQQVAALPEGRCRAALSSLVVLARVVKLPSGTYKAAA